MGLIKAFKGAISSGLGDQWLEVIEADEMNDKTVLTKGVTVRPNDPNYSNTNKTRGTISNGSIILVGENQFMLLVDGGKIVDYTAEAGYYKVDHSSLPSLFNGEFGDSLKETFKRFKYSGVTPMKEEAYFINLQEIKGIKFGTRNPVSYWDNFYNAELAIRSHGTYSIDITNPILFYKDQVSRNADRIKIDDINEQYGDEFLQALSQALNQLSVDGIRVSHLQSQGMKLSKHMADVLDDDWKNNRGIEIRSVGIGSISYTEESRKLIDKINMGMAFSDPRMREAYLQTKYVEGISKGLEDAGSNEGGAANAFMGLGLGMNLTGGNAGVGSFSQANMAQMKEDDKKAYEETVKRAQEEVDNMDKDQIKNTWTCPECESENSGNFCFNCGTKKPQEAKTSFKCSNCGHEVVGENPKFCPNCGTKNENI